MTGVLNWLDVVVAAGAGAGAHSVSTVTKELHDEDRHLVTVPPARLSYAVTRTAHQIEFLEFLEDRFAIVAGKRKP